MKRKLIASILATSMIFGVTALSACSKEDAGKDDEEIEESEESEDDKDDEDEDSSEDVTEATTETTIDDSLEHIDTSLWSISYDPEVWTYDPEYSFYEDDTYAYIDLVIPGDNEDSNNTCEVSITATIESPSSFRYNLNSRGYDLYEYANNAYDSELVNIGGADLLSYNSYYWGWEDACIYFNRFEGAGESIEVIVSDPNNADITALLNNLTFTINDTGNVDAPWPWEGEPINNGSYEASIDSYTLTSTQLVMDPSLVTFDTFDPRVAVSGDQFYVLDKNKIFVYTLSGDTLTQDSEYTLDDDYTEIYATPDGKIYLSSFWGFFEWADGEIVTTFEGDLDTIALSPDGSFGISWFVGNEISKVTFNSDGTTDKTDIILEGVEYISSVNVYDDCFIVSGSGVDENATKIYVYGLDGTLQQTLEPGADDWGLGSVTFVYKTSNGYMAMDGNMRTVNFWGSDGTYLGNLEDSDLFGTYYPWFAGSCISDGTFYTIMTEDRADDSGMEAIIYQVNGF